MKQATYVPILRWKRGETDALMAMYPADKALFTPLMELTSVPYDHPKKHYKLGLDLFLQKAAAGAKTFWGQSDEIFVDLHWLLEDQAAPKIQPFVHPFTFLFDEFLSNGIQAIPVVNGTEDAATIAAVSGIIRKDKRGLCLRLREPVLFEESLSTFIDTVLTTYALKASRVDLVIDFGSVIPGREAHDAVTARRIINHLPHLKAWRTLVLAASAFPNPVIGVKANTITLFPRSEWQIWNRVQTGSNIPNRVPIFGDYAINAPGWEEHDPRLISTSANIRYTSHVGWYFFKGRSLRNPKRGPGATGPTPPSPFLQFITLAKQVVAHAAYSGNTYCNGDDHIHQIASGTRKGKKPETGSQETWRNIGTNHHVTFVVRQIASLPATSGQNAPGLGSHQVATAPPAGRKGTV